jgi:glycosyltransferase involved in cell wall biosynthesis
MKVSVLMTVYNAESTIRDAVESILNQTYTDFEFIIINDASTDNTCKILNEIKDSRIRIFTNEENLGQIRSLNKGINLCKGKYIARMDSDDFSFPDRFKIEVDALDKEPDLAVVSTNGYMHFSNGRIKKIRHYPRNIDEIRFLSLFKSPIIHISVMIRRELINDSKVYDESFLISADWDLWSRILMKGLKIKVLEARSVWFFIANNTYARKNAEIEHSENIKIVKQNVHAFTGVEISDFMAGEIFALNLSEKSRLKVFIKRLILWYNISKRFRFASRWNYYKIFLRQILYLLYGYSRRILKPI